MLDCLRVEVGVDLSGVSDSAVTSDGRGVCASVDPAAVGPYAEELGLGMSSVIGVASRSVRGFLAGDGVARSNVASVPLVVCDLVSSCC